MTLQPSLSFEPFQSGSVGFKRTQLRAAWGPGQSPHMALLEGCRGRRRPQLHSSPLPVHLHSAGAAPVSASGNWLPKALQCHPCALEPTLHSGLQCSCTFGDVHGALGERAGDLVREPAKDFLRMNCAAALLCIYKYMLCLAADGGIQHLCPAQKAIPEAIWRKIVPPTASVLLSCTT